MNILAIDPATKCGWAHTSGPSGTWDLSIRRDESAGMRLIRFRAKLIEVGMSGVDLVVYEAARHAAPKMQGALVVQAELQSVIKVWCVDHRIEYRGYSPSEIKKHATGKGNAKKDDMMSAARAKWPAKAIRDDNEADALWLLDMATTTLADVLTPAVSHHDIAGPRCCARSDRI
jgi:Holliday junction resolvasome RuvABC endonuclease subunit